MKRCGAVKRTALSAALLLLGAAMPAAVAEQYLGEYCWDVTEGASSVPTGMARFGVYRYEGGHYTVLGTMTDYVQGVNVLNGNAEVLVGEAGRSAVIITVHGSNPVGAGLINMVLDASTLDGTYTGIVTLTVPTLTTETYSGIMVKREECE